MWISPGSAVHHLCSPPLAFSDLRPVLGFRLKRRDARFDIFKLNPFVGMINHAFGRPYPDGGWRRQKRLVVTARWIARTLPGGLGGRRPETLWSQFRPRAPPPQRCAALEARRPCTYYSCPLPFEPSPRWSHPDQSGAWGSEHYRMRWRTGPAVIATYFGFLRLRIRKASRSALRCCSGPGSRISPTPPG